MNKFEALAYMSKSPDNKVYRDCWQDGTKWMRLPSIEKGLVLANRHGAEHPFVTIDSFLHRPASSDLDDDWYVYEETYTVGQALDNVLASKGKLFAVGPARDTYRSLIIPDDDDAAFTYIRFPKGSARELFSKAADQEEEGTGAEIIVSGESTGWTIHNVPEGDK